MSGYAADGFREITPEGQEIIDALAAVEIVAYRTTTGGGCMALEVDTPTHQILITNDDADFPDGQSVMVGRFDKEEGDGDVMWERAGGYSVAEVVAAVTEIYRGVVNPPARRVGFIYSMDVAEGVTDVEIERISYDAYVQFSEAVPESADPARWSPPATSGVAMLRFDPATIDALTVQSAARGMTIPEYVAALAQIDADQ